MHNPNSGVLLAASLCAVASAQSRTFDGYQGAPAPSSHAESDLGGGADPLLRTTGERWQAQETDYSQHALFQQSHGDFMLKRERYNPAIEVRAQYMPDLEVQHEPGKFDLIRWSVDAEVPITVSPDGYVTLGGYFEQRDYETTNMTGFPDENLYAAALKFGFGWFFDRDWLLEGMVQPGYWTDWDGTLHSQDFDMPSKALLTYRTSDELFLKGGVRYNQIFQKANVLPYLGVSWQPSETFRLDVLAPESVEASLWLRPEFGLLLGSEIQGARYHVRSSAATGHQEANTHVQEILVYTGAIWRFSDYTSLGGRIGIAAAGDYKLEDGLPSTKRVDGTLETGFFFDLTFGIDF